MAVFAENATSMQKTIIAGACLTKCDAHQVLTLSKRLCDSYTYQLLAESGDLLWIPVAACLKYLLLVVVQTWTFLQTQVIMLLTRICKVYS